MTEFDPAAIIAASTILTPHQARSRRAAAGMVGDPDLITETRRDLAAANVAAEIQRRLTDAPPLTAAQVETLTSLIRSQGGAA